MATENLIRRIQEGWREIPPMANWGAATEDDPEETLYWGSGDVAYGWDGVNGDQILRYSYWIGSENPNVVYWELSWETKEDGVRIWKTLEQTHIRREDWDSGKGDRRWWMEMANWDFPWSKESE